MGLKDCPSRAFHNALSRRHAANREVAHFFKSREPGSPFRRRSPVWCGSSCQRFLIGFSLGQVGIGNSTKLTGLKRGPRLSFPPKHFFCSGNHLTAQMEEITAIKKGPSGAQPTSKLSDFTPNILIARCKKLEQGNLLSPTPTFFWAPLTTGSLPIKS